MKKLILLYISIFLFSICLSTYAYDSQSVTVRNATGVCAYDLHLTLSGIDTSVVFYGIRILDNNNNCSIQDKFIIGGNTIILKWGSCCVDPNQKVVFILKTSTGPIGFVSGYWSDVNGVNIGNINAADVDFTPCPPPPQCGPGLNWVSSCSAGIDSLDLYHCSNTTALLGTLLGNSCLPIPLPDTLKGPTIVQRDNPVGNTIATEILEMTLTGNVMGMPATVRAGAGKGVGPFGGSLQPSYGGINQLVNQVDASTYFDVFFEIEVETSNGPLFLYNQQPLYLATIIDRVPPRIGIDPNTGLAYTIYRSLPGICLGLFTNPFPGLGLLIANAVSEDHALPVELSSFNSIINARNVKLNWTTATEENNSGFDVEKSVLNGEWSKVGFVTGQGNSTVSNNYSFEDKNLSSGRYNYRLKQIDYNGNFQYFDLQNEVVIGIPEKFGLAQNYPNPFNPTTKINYDISKDGYVRLTIYDNVGREVRTLVNEFRSAGYYTADFDAANLPSGVYFYKLESNNLTATKKMVIMK